MNDHDITWFLAQFKPNSHYIAERNLTRQGFRTFLPMQKQTSRARGRFVTKLRPLFPGYLLVALDLMRGDWRVVNSTYGVSRLVSLGKEPTPVPKGLVRDLMSRCDREGTLLVDNPFQPGDEVMLTSGPFTEFVATIERITPDRRIYVLMELMGAQTRVAVCPESLRAV